MQLVDTKFHQLAQNSVIPIDWDLQISFTKEFDDDVTWFTYDVSEYNGPDVYSPSADNPIQQWDKYVYENYKDRVVSLEYERSIAFPYSVQAAIADVTLNNFDDYFTPHSGSPVEDYILPKRPLRIYTGFQSIGAIPQLVGLSQGMPEIEEDSKTASFHVLDFLSEIYNMELNKTIAMRDVTTDVVIAAILTQFEILPSQYSLAKGRNIIPFLFFEKGMNAGEALNKLMEAEMGKLWLDEQGIIRFEQRLVGSETPVITFNEHNIVSFSTTGDDEIINDIRINSDVRAVQAFQPIYSNAQDENYSFSAESSFLIPANTSVFFPDASLENPAISHVIPTLGVKQDTSWFTAKRLNGVEVSSGISITFATLYTDSYTMLFQNTNAFDVYVDQVEVWGEPAKIVDQIRYRAYDEDSVLKYGSQILEISNNFFGSTSNCDSFAEYALDAYKEYAGVVEFSAKGDPSLQLADIITLDKAPYTGTYKVISIKQPLRRDNFLQTIKARKYTVRDWFIYNVSEYNGTDVYAP